MAELLVVLDEEFQRAYRRERVFLEIFDDIGLIKRFRFPKSVILTIVNLCHSKLERKTWRSRAIPVHTQVLAALRFFASGSYQQCTSDSIGISQPSQSRVIASVAEILIENACSFVNFGVVYQERKIGFYGLAQFPNVIGVVDGTHIKIQSPGGTSESLYVCRKGGYSINVQIVCDHQMFITDAVVKWPGSNHDSFIWKNCSLRDHFVRSPPDGYLLGDSGYCLEPWLLTPFSTSQTLTFSQANYQESFVKTRRIVENTIGLWKNIFRCLIDNVLLYNPTKVCKIISGTIVLHNLRRSLRLRQDDLFEATPEEDDDVGLRMEDSEITRMGFSTRENVVLNCFT